MEVEIGKVVHYNAHLGTAVLALVDDLKLGDKIHFAGSSTNFTQRVSYMEVRHHSLVWVKPGSSITIKVSQPVNEYDAVFLVVEDVFASVF